MNILKILLVLLICFGLAGCATTSSKYGYSGVDLNAEHFKGFNDEQMLVLFDRIYDLPAKTRPDETAKDITVTAFMIALESRAKRSGTIEESGVLAKPYKKIELNKWSDNDLVNAYNSISKERDKTQEVVKKIDEKNINKVRDNEGRSYWSFKEIPKRKKEKISADDNRTTLEIIQLTALFAVDSELNRRDTVKRTWQTVGSATMEGISIATRVAIMLAGFLI